MERQFKGELGNIVVPTWHRGNGAVLAMRPAIAVRDVGVQRKVGRARIVTEEIAAIIGPMDGEEVKGREEKERRKKGWKKREEEPEKEGEEKGVKMQDKRRTFRMAMERQKNSSMKRRSKQISEDFGKVWDRQNRKF